MISVAYVMHGARNVGGGENSIFQLMTNLDQFRFYPIVIYSKDNHIIKKIKKKGIETIKFHVDPDILGLYRNQIKLNIFSLIKYSFKIFKVALRLRLILKAKKIDLIHPHDNLSKIICGLVAITLKSKVICHSRDLLNKSFIEKFLKIFQLSFMDAIIAVSNANKKSFKINGKISKKVKVVYNGIDLLMFLKENQNTSKKSDYYYNNFFIVGIVGVFDEVKGHIYLFKALKLLFDDGNNNLRCLVVGDGRQKDFLLKWVKDNEMDKVIIFVGFKKDIRNWLKIINVLTIPSIQESFPRVALEAMAHKLAVIGSNVGGIPEAVTNGETGIIIDKENIELLVKALNKLMHNSKLRIDMGTNGYEKCKSNFTLKLNVKETEKIYKQVLTS